MTPRLEPDVAAEEDPRQDLEPEDHDDRRDVERAADRRDGAAHRTEQRLGDRVEERERLGHRRARPDREPAEDDPGEERDEVEVEDEAEETQGQSVSRSRRFSSADTSTLDGVSRYTWF